jgi:Mitochondrial carrier protein
MSIATKRKKTGVEEGIARALTQGCIYGLEARKTIQQVCKKSPIQDPVRMLGGMITSMLASGIVFSSYFSVYHGIGAANPWAGPVAAGAVSSIKQPISNMMRLLHTGITPNIVAAGCKIVRVQGVRGLYCGYTASLAEDLIEWDVRTRLYEGMCGATGGSGAVLGGVAGMMAAWITTPFDTVRANAAIAATKSQGANVLSLAINMYSTGGLKSLYRGARLRAISSGLKMALFYAILECI